MRTVEEEVVPAYRATPGFLGLFILHSQPGRRNEFVGLSLWAETLADSEPIIGEFTARLEEIAGVNATRVAYDVITFAAPRPIA